ncbi:heterogeneous nuclear ribonucleoprotein F-like [Dendronephthya gigantea]|uniref:heterogeneous nuclear ribonucleoprotein F-like n=1 Tax=Dendronephthya gigantea TaxID=151771 RepID=UPI001069BF46|nr:heterogeneous nuclear ribonucleoprotein F-like [Dendronephthya gigantea]
MPVIIKLKGMPWQTTSRDIKSFFRDSKIAEHDIHLAPNEDGKACGVGFACFYDDEDARRAMQRNGAYIGKRYVELFLSSQTEMEKALRDGVAMIPKSPGGRFSRGGGVADKSSSRSSRERSRSPRDRSDSKYGKGVALQVIFSESHSPVRSSRGSSFSTSRTSANGRDSNDREGGFRRGGGQGHTDRGSRGFRGRGRGRGRGSYSFSTTRSQDNSSRDSKSLRSKHDSPNDRGSFRTNTRAESSTVSSGEKGLFLKLTGMPYTAKDEDILQFLKGVNVAAVYIIPNKQGKHVGKSSGSAFVECATQDDCIKALKRHGQFLGNRYINVTRCTLEEIVSTLNIDMSLLSSAFPGDTSARDRSGQSTFNPSSFSSNISTRAPVSVDNSASMVAASANINLADIKDGCVVGIRNLPVSTTSDDILRLFRGFPAIPDSVRIHYIDANRCSGDAMITLVSNERAKIAIRELSGKQMGGRKIEMFLL